MAQPFQRRSVARVDGDGVSAEVAVHWAAEWSRSRRAELRTTILPPFGFEPNDRLDPEGAAHFLPLGAAGYARVGPVLSGSSVRVDEAIELDAAALDSLDERDKLAPGLALRRRPVCPSEAIMNCSFLYRALAAAALTAAITIPAGAQSIVGKGKTGPVPDPVNLDIAGMFQAKFVSVGDDLFIGGQPTEKALRDLKAKGVTTVVNLRMPEEMAKVEFDEAALATQLGIKYVHIPMRGSAANPYGPKELDRFAAALAGADGKVLLHCTVAWRASHLWAAYLIRDRQVPVASALAHTRQINLRDDMPFGGQQPLEGFLGRTIPEMAQPKP